MDVKYKFWLMFLPLPYWREKSPIHTDSASGLQGKELFLDESTFHKTNRHTDPQAK